eukprot:Rmarinus@m.22038
MHEDVGLCLGAYGSFSRFLEIVDETTGDSCQIGAEDTSFIEIPKSLVSTARANGGSPEDVCSHPDDDTNYAPTSLCSEPFSAPTATGARVVVETTDLDVRARHHGREGSTAVGVPAPLETDEPTDLAVKSTANSDVDTIASGTPNSDIHPVSEIEPPGSRPAATANGHGSGPRSCEGERTCVSEVEEACRDRTCAHDMIDIIPAEENANVLSTTAKDEYPAEDGEWDRTEGCAGARRFSSEETKCREEDHRRGADSAIADDTMEDEANHVPGGLDIVPCEANDVPRELD